MPKRGSERQINKDDYEEEETADDGRSLREGFSRASSEQLRRRKIVKAYVAFSPAAKSHVSAASSAKPNPFASINLFPANSNTSTAPNPFSSEAKSPPSNGNRDLNDVFADHILKQLENDPSRDLSLAALDYCRYVHAIRNKYGNNGNSSNAANATALAASTPTFSFGGPPSLPRTTPAPSFSFATNPAPASSDAKGNDNKDNCYNSTEKQDKESTSSTTSIAPNLGGDYEVIYRVEPVLFYSTDQSGFLQKFDGGDDLHVRLEKHRTKGTYICTLRDSSRPRRTFAIAHGLEFHIVSRKAKNGVVKRSLRFMAVPVETNELTTCEMRTRDATFDELVEHVRQCGAVVKGGE